MQQAQEGLLATYQNALATGAAEMQRAQDALASGGKDLHRALSWIDELDAIVSAILDSRSWKIGRAITAGVRRLLGRSQISAAERRDRLMAEIRSWWRRDAGE